MTAGATVPVPGWSDVLRFPDGARLRVEVILEPALRKAMRHASRNAALWLESIDGAMLRLEQRSDRASRLTCATAAGTAKFIALRASGEVYRLRGRVGIPEGMRQLDLDGITVQLGGGCDAYLVQWSGTELRHLARFRYGAHGNPADVSIYSTVLASRLAPAIRALLPNPIALVRLTWVTDGNA